MKIVEDVIMSNILPNQKTVCARNELESVECIAKYSLIPPTKNK